MFTFNIPCFSYFTDGVPRPCFMPNIGKNLLTIKKYKYLKNTYLLFTVPSKYAVVDQEIAQWLIYSPDETVRAEIFDCLYMGDIPTSMKILFKL